MKFGVVTLFPGMIEDALGHGVLSRAIACGRVVVECVNPRDHASDAHRTVDDRPFGGGPGMVMKPEPLSAAIRALRASLPAAPVVALTPQGRRFDQALARRWAAHGSLVLVAGRYEGMDERVMAREIDEEVSLGDFVLSGGEPAALAIVDAVSRLVPDVLGHARSAEEDSFGEDGLLDCPHWTRPEVWEGQGVPAELLSGDHARIVRWRRDRALARTRSRRPELLERAVLDAEDERFLRHLDETEALAGPDGQVNDIQVNGRSSET